MSIEFPLPTDDFHRRGITISFVTFFSYIRFFRMFLQISLHIVLHKEVDKHRRRYYWKEVVQYRTEENTYKWRKSTFYSLISMSMMDKVRHRLQLFKYRFLKSNLAFFLYYSWVKICKDVSLLHYLPIVFSCFSQLLLL